MTTNNPNKTLASISYLTIIGVIIAYFLNNDKRDSFTYFHIRQSLGLWLTYFLVGYLISNIDSWLGTIGFWIAFGVLFFYGISTALLGKTTPIPLVGNIYHKLFKSIA